MTWQPSEVEEIFFQRITKGIPDSVNIKKAIRGKLVEVMKNFKTEKEEWHSEQLTKAVHEMLNNIDSLEAAIFSGKKVAKWPADRLSNEQKAFIEKRSNL